MTDYQEPKLTFAILDFLKPVETYHAISSIRERTKFPHKIVYLHNGPAEHAYPIFQAGLVDTFVQTSKNNGLGVGTRDVMSLVHSPYTIMWQNDQIMNRDFFEDEFNRLIELLPKNVTNLQSVLRDEKVKYINSISLAGPTAGVEIYSERAHIIPTSSYRFLESVGVLGPYGAGPYHHGPWREEQIQKYYKANNLIHITDYLPLAMDIGKWTIRDCAGGRVKMRTDTKAVTWEIPPTEKYVFPEHTEQEWTDAIAGKWPAGKIPQIYLDKKESFNCWEGLNL